MSIPNLQHEVEAARQKYPQAWRDAHTGNPQTEDFIRLCVRDIREKHGDRWGLNGKRGNPNDISDDVVAYAGEGTAVDSATGGPMEIIDVIASAGTPGATPVWNVGPGGAGDVGTVVKQFTVPGTSEPEPPVTNIWLQKHTTLLGMCGTPNPDAQGQDRDWVKRVAQQFKFTFPEEGWCCKSAAPGRPQSGDVLGRKYGGSLIGFKIVPKPQGVAPVAINLAGQNPIEVEPVDHIGGQQPPGPVLPPAGMPPYMGDNNGQNLGAILFHDYSTAGQSPNAGMGTWFARVTDTYMRNGGDFQSAVIKHRAEWCAALGIPV